MTDRREQPPQHSQQSHRERADRHDYSPPRRPTACRLHDGREQDRHTGQDQEDDECRRQGVGERFAFE